MRKYQLMALAIVSATALGALPALAASDMSMQSGAAATSGATAGTQSGMQSGMQSGGVVWNKGENPAAKRESMGTVTSDTASQSGNVPSEAQQSDARQSEAQQPDARQFKEMHRERALSGAQPSFGPGTTAASRHHG